MNDGGPAFPCDMEAGKAPDLYSIPCSGMSIREYAAIKLRVPESGVDWLDEMIRKANRDWFAGMALPPIMQEAEPGSGITGARIAAWAYDQADEMLAEREGEA